MRTIAPARPRCAPTPVHTLAHTLSARTAPVALLVLAHLFVPAHVGAQPPASRALSAFSSEVRREVDRVTQARARDTLDGDARARHPVRVAAWRDRWERTTDPDLRLALAAAVLQHADTTQLTAAQADALGAGLTPTSPVWVLPWAHYADAVGAALRLGAFRTLDPDRAAANAPFRARWLAVLDSTIARPDAHPQARLAALVRAARVRGRRESREAAQPYITTLLREFPTEHATTVTAQAYGGGGPVRVGERLADFRVTSLDGTHLITRDSLAGRVVLLDFWATWCGPCTEEMPIIARTWQRYRARGFEVLSVSMDSHAGLVPRYRRARHPMPWRHAWAAILDDLPVLLGVKVVPRAVLIGRDGTVLALDDELRGEALEATVRAALSAPPPSGSGARSGY